jgi:tetratricopeptide (TPR) repeat protein
VARLANALNAQLIAVEARRAERTPTPDSMDLFFQGMAWVNRGVSADSMAKARVLFERALALDSANVDALVGMATVDVNVAVGLSSEDRISSFEAAEAAAAKALSLAPEHPIAHLIMGMVLGFTNRAGLSIAEYDRALTLDRNLAGAHALIGQSKLLCGRGEETEAHVEEALRLSPRDPWAYAWLVIVGLAKSVRGRPQEAIRWLRRSMESNRNYPLCRFLLAAALADVGQTDEARIEAGAGLMLDPQFTIARFRAIAWSDNPTYVAGLTRVINSMLSANVPEK